MTFDLSNLDKVEDPFRAEVLKAAKVENGKINIGTRTYYAIAKAEKIDFFKAQSIALGQSQIKLAAGRLKSFAIAMAGTDIVNPKVTEEVELARRKICEACPEYLPDQKRCAQCGCSEMPFLPNKWQWKTSNCPLGNWPAVPSP